MKQPYNTTIYNTALYMRLSRDDENYGDSVSIETQRTILQQYAKEQGLHVVGEYVEEKKWLKRIAQKSDLLKNPKPQRGRK